MFSGKRISGFLIGSFTLAWVLSFSTVVGAQTQTTRLSIATGGAGGVFYVVGGAIAALISKHLPGVESTAEVTAASVDNCKLIMAKKADMGFSLADTAYDAYAGLERFKATGKIPLRALAVFYPAVSPIISIGGTGIDKVKDFRWPVFF